MTATRAIVTDIEGTTSSIHFVHQVLFPYARQRLPAFVEAHGDRAEVQHWLHEAAKEAGIIGASQTEIVGQLLRWIDEDRKSTALKALQGMIWQAGFEAGDYRAHFYPEVAERLRAWHAQGIALYVYSSGSVLAQKQFFGFSESGNLSALISGYFDTQTGPKRETASYTRIAQVIGLPPEQILFLSDVVEELDAARHAGFRAGWLVREPLAIPADPAHPAYADFNAIAI